MNYFYPKDNKAFQWFCHDNVWCKGFIFNSDGNILQGIELCQYFTCDYEDQFRKKLNHANGSFSVVVLNDSITFGAVDRLRTFPLFFKENYQSITISDMPDSLMIAGDDSGIDPGAISGFRACGFVPGNNTLYRAIKQLRGGEYLVYQPFQKAQIKPYYSFAKSQDAANSNPEQQLINIIHDAFSRFYKLIKDRQAVVPLSGGFDSRLIVSLLKEYQHKDVVCFTYGKKNNKEVHISEKVAAKLGFRWYHIPFEKEKNNNFPDSKFFLDYYQYASRYTSMFFMQEFFPVKYLKENKHINEDAVFIPGHSADFLAGSHLNDEIFMANSLNRIAQLIYDKYFSFIPQSPKAKNALKTDILNLISRENDQKKPFSVFEDWVMKERQAKFIVNSSRVYSFFDHKFYHPLWDLKLIDFFGDLPVEYRKNKFLYNQVVRDHVFKKYDIDFAAYKKSPPKLKKLSFLKSLIKSFLPATINYNKIRKADTINYAEITKLLNQHLQAKKLPVHHPVNDFNEVLIHWYLYKEIYSKL
ncbi:MAG: asparagine synthase C-terminal domain-containing protein [Bacteroidales bacterium]|nr:asparagine synthase C-terminal domain-containing protein [Bacteroidales bacterium]